MQPGTVRMILLFWRLGSELDGATLGANETDAYGDHWLHLVGKGGKAGNVVLPPLARAGTGLLAELGIPTTRAQQNPNTRLIGSLDSHSEAGIIVARPVDRDAALLSRLRRSIDLSAQGRGQAGAPDRPGVYGAPVALPEKNRV
jgi:hypothetical protein